MYDMMAEAVLQSVIQTDFLVFYRQFQTQSDNPSRFIPISRFCIANFKPKSVI